jgi:signal transduction histidine kinase
LFIQLDSSSTRRYGGAGVGLPLVKLILDHHQSQIHVKSEPEQGSTFSFRLKRMKIEDDIV